MNVNWLSYEGGTICINVDKLPKAILVTEKDKRGREVYSAKVHRFEPERGECHVECFDDGVDEGLDGEWYSYAPPKWYLSCGHEVEGSERPKFCSTCGRKVVDE